MRHRKIAAEGRSVELKQLAAAEVQAVTATLERRQAQTADQPLRCLPHRSLWLMWRLCATLGLRSCEALGLRYTPSEWLWDPANDDAAGLPTLRFWVVRAKGGVSGWVILAGSLATQLWAHLQILDMQPGSPVICGQSGQALSRSRVSQMLSRSENPWGQTVWDESGVDICERQTFHALRHHVAWRVWEQSGNIRAVQALLGHRKLETTSRYLQQDEAVRERFIHTAALAAQEY